MPERDAKRDDNMYRFEPSFDGPHLVMKIHRVGSRTDAQAHDIEVYPYAKAIHWPDLFSTTIKHTWHATTVAGAIAILSKNPDANVVEEGPIEDNNSAAQLQADWASRQSTHPRIELLPRDNSIVSEPNDLLQQGTVTESASSAVIGRLPLAVSHRFETDREAFKYLAGIYGSDNLNPKLLRIRDTHARAESRSLRYGDNYRENGQAFKKFLSGEDQGAIRGAFIVGATIDEDYVKWFIGAAQGHENQIEVWRLPAPIFSFIILDFEDATHEVLFGWGRLGTPWGVGVFVSKDQHLVQAFGHYFEMLKSSAKLVSLESLVENKASDMQH